MIRDHDAGGFQVGSLPPKMKLRGDSFDRFTDDDERVASYLDERLWEKGVGVTIVGPPASGRTSLGVLIIRALLNQQEPPSPVYWTEHDYLSDLRTLMRYEDMVAKLPRDDALWGEYVDWEQNFWRLKESPFLFVDDACRSYTPFQWYEMENLLRERDSRNLPTLVSVEAERWASAEGNVRSLLSKKAVLVNTKVQSS